MIDIAMGRPGPLSQEVNGRMSWGGQVSEFAVRPDDEPTQRLRRNDRPGVLSAITGVITAATVLLALLVVLGKLFGQARHLPGPSGLEVGLHVTGAVVALGLQLVLRWARVGVRILAAFGIVAVTGALLWLFWWA